MPFTVSELRERARKKRLVIPAGSRKRDIINMLFESEEEMRRVFEKEQDEKDNRLRLEKERLAKEKRDLELALQMKRQREYNVEQRDLEMSQFITDRINDIVDRKLEDFKITVEQMIDTEFYNRM